MTTMKLVIIGVFLALGGIQLADCIFCLSSDGKKTSFHLYKQAELYLGCTEDKCLVEYDPESSYITEVVSDDPTKGQVLLRYGCGACLATKYCKDCTGEKCNKASVFNLNNDLERDLVPCLANTKHSGRIPTIKPTEIFCRPSEMCLKFFAKSERKSVTIIGCERALNKLYGEYHNTTYNFERYECRPNAKKSDCITLRMLYPPPATATAADARHPNWLFVSVLLGCTMLLALFI